MRVLVYANVNLDLIDGSTIWVRSISELLAGPLNCDVVVLSRDVPAGRGVVPGLLRNPRIRIVSGADFPDIVAQHPTPGDRWGIEKMIRSIDAQARLDRIVIREMQVSALLCRVVSLRDRVWAYVLKSPELDASREDADLATIVGQAAGILVQSETQRALLEAVFAPACNKTSVLPPMVAPVEIAVPAAGRGADGPVRLVYSGKYSKDWNVEAFFELPAACTAAGVEAAVTMVGDKVHREPDDPGFRQRILNKLGNTPGVTWLGAVEREEAMAGAAAHDLGLCWRTSALDDSLEISTKFLEFASVGVPSIINHTAAYEALLGEDYPYFASTLEDAVAAVRLVRSDPERHARMRERCKRLAQDFSYASVARKLGEALRIAGSRPPRAEGRKPVVLVASHDLKFLDLAIRYLAESGKYDLVIDRWRTTTSHDEAASLRALGKADIVFCEWCAGQAVWYSRRKRPGQKLFVRLHRFEAFRSFPRELDGNALDGVLVVSDHFRDICIKNFGWPPGRILVLPQYCAAGQLDRAKNRGADRTLGFVGINGFHHKRFDRAVEILRLVRRSDPQFRMRVRSAMPWEFDWIWKDNHDERNRFKSLFEEIEADEDLRDAIIFDRPGADMAEWYRNVGFILSTSESEGCHTSVAEGICSGAQPVVIDWPGARSVYGESCVFRDTAEMADAIVGAGSRPADARALRSEGAERFDVSRTVAQLERWFDG